MPNLLDLFTRDPYVPKLLKALASQDDFGSDVTPARVEEILNCSRHQAIQILRALGETKVVKFVVGRRRHRTRLEWGFPRDVVAEEVINEVNKYIDMLAEQAEADDEGAQEKLEGIATAVGIKEWKVKEAENWAAVGKMILPRGRGTQEAQVDESGQKGAAILFSTESEPAEDVVLKTSQNPFEPKFEDTKILLRPDLWVILSLPKDLTENEAARLSGVVRNLWLVPSNGKDAGTQASGSE